MNNNHDVPSYTYSWYVITVLLLAQTFSFLDRMIMGLLVGPIRAAFDISDTQYSLLAGLAFSLFYALMGLPLARIADSRNRRNLIAVGITIWSFMTACCGLAKSFSTLFFARVGVGVGEATLGPAAYSMISDYFPRSKLGKALSVYTLGVTLGSGLAYMLGGAVVGYVQNIGNVDLPLLGSVYGWQVTFFIVGLPGLFVAVLMATTVREPVRTGISLNDEMMPIREVLTYLWSRRRAYASHIFGISIFVMVVYALNLWGPTYFIRTFSLSPEEAGWTFGLIMLCAGSTGLLLAGTIADYWMQKGTNDAYIRLILISIVLMMPCVIALGFVDDLFFAILAMTAAVFFSAFQGGIAGGTLQLMTPNRMRGQAMAIYLLVANLIGLGLGPTVLAATTDYIFSDDMAIGKSMALCAAVLCPLGGAILFYGLSDIRHQIEVLAEGHVK
jgi:MFS family permease